MSGNGTKPNVDATIINIAESETVDNQKFDDQIIIPINPFPLKSLPRKLRRAIKKIATAHNTESAVVASLMLVILSGCIGNTVRVSPKPGFEMPVFLWLMFIADSGYGKSPLIKALMRFIEKREAKAYKIYSRLLAEYQKQVKTKNVSISEKGWSSKAVDPDIPTLEHLTCTDATVEGVAPAFETSPRGLISAHDELSGLFTGLNQYKNGKGNDLQRYLELYNCSAWKIIRKTGTLLIPNTGLAILGGIQTGILTCIFSHKSFSQGLMPRFLLILPEARTLQYSRESLSPKDLEPWENIIDYCYEIPLTLDEDGEVEPKILTLSPEAIEIWETFYNSYGAKQAFLSDKARLFIPKLLNVSLKLAGILHIINTAEGDDSDDSDVISKEIISDAIELTKYYAGQIIKVCKLYNDDDTQYSETHKRIIKAIYESKDKINKGRLKLNDIRDAYNRTILPALKLASNNRELSHVLTKDFNLSLRRSTGGFRFLIWEEDKLNKLFSTITVTNVTNVTESKGTAS